MANARTMNVYVEYTSGENIGRIIGAVRENDVHVYDIEITKGDPKNGIAPSVVFSVRLPKKYSHSAFLSELSKAEGVTAVEEL